MNNTKQKLSTPLSKKAVISIVFNALALIQVLMASAFSIYANSKGLMIPDVANELIITGMLTLISGIVLCQCIKNT